MTSTTASPQLHARALRCVEHLGRADRATIDRVDERVVRPTTDDDLLRLSDDLAAWLAANPNAHYLHRLGAGRLHGLMVAEIERRTA